MLLWDYWRQPRFIEGPMLQMVTPEGFTLVWRIHPNRPMNLEVLSESGEHVVAVTAESAIGRQVATVHGLKPNTGYDCVITDADQRPLLKQRLRTAPTDGTPLCVLVFGDSGDGRRPQRQLARRMSLYQPDLILHTGDLIYDRGEPEGYRLRFYQPYASLLRATPFYPCLGNHDVRTANGQAMIDNFILPENGPPGIEPERNYWFDYGGTRFVALDSNAGGLADNVAPWFDQVLTEAGDRWKIVFFHEPVYTNSKHPPAAGIRDEVIPVIGKHRVALVLCGHNHLYERTHPLRDGQPVFDQPGTVYVTTGAGGARLYEPASARPPFIARQLDATHSFTLVNITPETLSVRQIDIDGECIDEFRIPAPRPAASP